MAARLSPPTLPARRIVCAGKPSRTVLWCPWCEQEHWHGEVAGRENRAPHCLADRRSPLGRTGYDVEVVGRARSAAAVIPRRPLGFTGRLHEVAGAASGGLRKTMLRHLLARRTIPAGSMVARTPAGRVQILEDGTWRIEPRQRRALAGRGLIALASALYGLSPGIAAVRLLEAVSGDVLDEEAAFGLQAVIEAWQARGAPRRPERG